MPGTEGIQGGFEGGQLIKVGDTYHMFPTERAGEIGEPARYDRIKTRIGHWTSKDAIHWERQSTSTSRAVSMPFRTTTTR